MSEHGIRAGDIFYDYTIAPFLHGNKLEVIKVSRQFIWFNTYDDEYGIRYGNTKRKVYIQGEMYPNLENLFIMINPYCKFDLQN
jgi:hypothetical protein